MRRVATIILAATLLCSSCISRRSGSVALGGAQIITLSDSPTPDTVDMGVVRSGERLSKTIALHNATLTPAVITSMETACGCLRLEYPPQPLLPSQTLSATLSFDSTGYHFWLPHTVKIYTSIADPPFEIVVMATIK